MLTMIARIGMCNEVVNNHGYGYPCHVHDVDVVSTLTMLLFLLLSLSLSLLRGASDQKIVENNNLMACCPCERMMIRFSV